MARDSPAYRCSYEMTYEADSGARLDRNVLARIRYGSAPSSGCDPREVTVALPQAGVAPLAEVWRSHLPVRYGWADGFGLAHNGEVLFGQLHLDESQIADLAHATASAYVRADMILRRMGYPSWLRVWNFVGHINHGEGDAERYRQFCRGRYHALALKPGFETQLPAATAIGTGGAGMTLYFLAARDPGEQVENPRQVSAFRYPAAYGPKSPSFSRANLKHWADGIHLFVSGTASVVGHRTLHAGDALAQLDETWRNFEAVLQQATAQRPMAAPFRAAGLKIFLRCREHLGALLPRARQLFGAEVPLLWLAGDICRRDLMLEIEGLFTAAPLAAQRQVAA